MSRRLGRPVLKIFCKSKAEELGVLLVSKIGFILYCPIIPTGNYYSHFHHMPFLLIDIIITTPAAVSAGNFQCGGRRCKRTAPTTAVTCHLAEMTTVMRVVKLQT
jgi:hypothetical protein